MLRDKKQLDRYLKAKQAGHAKASSANYNTTSKTRTLQLGVRAATASNEATAKRRERRPPMNGAKTTASVRVHLQNKKRENGIHQTWFRNCCTIAATQWNRVSYGQTKTNLRFGRDKTNTDNQTSRFRVPAANYGMQKGDFRLTGRTTPKMRDKTSSITQVQKHYTTHLVISQQDTATPIRQVKTRAVA